MAADKFAGIDFDEISEVCSLEHDEIKVLKLCFDLFDVKKQEFLGADDLDDILRAMGFRPSKEELQEILLEIDEDGSGEIEFGEFCQLCAKFLVEEPDEETMKAELKEAFRVYDKEGLGFITTGTLREIIGQLDPRLTSEDLDGIIEEIDEDGSGTMDFDEFCGMMMS
jgi:calmodulin